MSVNKTHKTHFIHKCLNIQPVFNESWYGRNDQCSNFFSYSVSFWPFSLIRLFFIPLIIFSGHLFFDKCTSVDYGFSYVFLLQKDVLSTIKYHSLTLTQLLLTKILGILSIMTYLSSFADKKVFLYMFRLPAGCLATFARTSSPARCLSRVTSGERLARPAGSWSISSRTSCEFKHLLQSTSLALYHRYFKT